MKKTKPKPLTDKQKAALLRRTLFIVQEKHFHFPDSDAREYCAGCGRSPYNEPPHTTACLVVRVAYVLERTK